MKKRLFSLGIAAILAICLAGCTTTQITEQMQNAPPYDSTYDLGNGLSLGIETRDIEDDSLSCISVECITDGSAFSHFTFTPQAENARGYLQHKTDGQKYDDVEALISDGCMLYFDQPVTKDEWSAYTLHFECSAEAQANDNTSHTVTVPLTENQAVLNEVISLPLDNSIQITKVEKRTGYTEFSSTCADIYFTVSAGISNFNIYVDKSAIVTGQEPGTLTRVDETHYIYAHPIEQTEKEILFSFQHICITDKIICDIQL